MSKSDSDCDSRGRWNNRCRYSNCYDCCGCLDCGCGNRSSDDECSDYGCSVCRCPKEQKICYCCKCDERNNGTIDTEHEDSLGTSHNGLCLYCDCANCVDCKRNNAVPFCEWCHDPLTRPDDKPVKYKTFNMNKPTRIPKRNMKVYDEEFPDGSLYDGSLSHGKSYGFSKYCYTDNFIVLTGNIHYGKWSGACTLFYETQEIHGKFKKGKFVESYRFVNGRYYGYFNGTCQGRFHGVDFELYSNGDLVIKRR